jgi:hypothetical protein
MVAKSHARAYAQDLGSLQRQFNYSCAFARLRSTFPSKLGAVAFSWTTRQCRNRDQTLRTQDFSPDWRSQGRITVLEMATRFIGRVCFLPLLNCSIYSAAQVRHRRRTIIRTSSAPFSCNCVTVMQDTRAREAKVQRTEMEEETEDNKILIGTEP